jgi:transcriptional regulator with XRE-family HTH domain
VTAARTIKAIRERSGLGLRELARLGGTSHATLHAYESGAKEPRLDTIARLADAAGFALQVDLAPLADLASTRAAKARELVEVLELAAVFPARHSVQLTAPVFGPRAT